MSTEPYTPDRGTVRYRYVDGDYSGGNRDPHVEFDRFIAKIKADALREAAEAWQVETNGVRPGPSNFMVRRADQIENGENDD